MFRAAVKSKYTLDPYERRLANFLTIHKMKCDEFVGFAKADKNAIEKMIIDFVLKEKQRAQDRAIVNSTVSNFLKPIKLLLEMNDVALNWKKIKRLLPTPRRFALDRIPTIEELRTIVEMSDLRGKALTLVFTSSGIREGAIEWLQVGHLKAIKTSDGRVIGKLSVYAGDQDQYITFISQEAYYAVQDYLAWREEHGEKITAHSPLFRDKFDPIETAYLTYGGGRPEKPKVMTGATVRAYYNRLLYDAGIRKGPQKRHEFTVHGFRKWFKTKMENAGAKPIVTEMLMGHSVGISDSYYRPSERDLLEDYLKALASLSILETTELRIQNTEQKREFDEQIQAVNQRVDSLIAQFVGGRPSVK